MEEISEIQKAKALGNIHKKEGIGRAQAADRLSISPESEKKAMWVEMLKEMPDVRPEKIEEASGHASPTSRELAQKILNSSI